MDQDQIGEARGPGRPRSVIDPDGRCCSKCNVFKPWGDFTPWTKGVNGRKPQCRVCRLSESSPRSPERRLDEKMRSRYGITADQMRSMRATQQFRCFICHTHELNLGKRLVVDHCHKNKYVRKMLCDRCNRVLGFCREDSGIFRAMADYLDMFEGRSILTRNGLLDV